MVCVEEKYFGVNRNKKKKTVSNGLFRRTVQSRPNTWAVHFYERTKYVTEGWKLLHFHPLVLLPAGLFAALAVRARGCLTVFIFSLYGPCAVRRSTGAHCLLGNPSSCFPSWLIQWTCLSVITPRFVLLCYEIVVEEYGRAACSARIFSRVTGYWIDHVPAVQPVRTWYVLSVSVLLRGVPFLNDRDFLGQLLKVNNAAAVTFWPLGCLLPACVGGCAMRAWRFIIVLFRLAIKPKANTAAL